MKWPLQKIEAIRADARNSLVGGPFGSELTTRDYYPEGVPVIRGVNLPDERRFLDDKFVFVTEEKADQLAANNAHAGDVVFTQRGTLGQVGLIPSEPRFDRYLISQSQMKLTVDKRKVDPRFVFYFFRHPVTVQQIKNRAITSGVPHINLGILRDFDIPTPPVAVQGRIADALSAYDDLIENNRRRMALLEDSARQLYQEWFVRLRFPGHAHVRIRDGVPDRWKRGKISDYFDTASGGTPSRKVPEYFTGEIPWVKTGELLGGFVTATEERITENAFQDSATKFFPERTVLIALYGATVGALGILAMPATTN
jgi:type I restriction enzyme, S subunit